MARAFKLPDLGEGIHEGEVITVLVSVATIDPNTAHQGRSRSPSRYDCRSPLLRPTHAPIATTSVM